MQVDLLARYRVLQQECDFALWRAREANSELRGKYAACVRGEGFAPAEGELAALHELERDAETKYRELRTFLREEVAQAGEPAANRELALNLDGARA